MNADVSVQEEPKKNLSSEIPTQQAIQGVQSETELLEEIWRDSGFPEGESRAAQWLV